MTRSRICKTWADRIESGVFTKTQCQQYARSVVALAEGHQPGGHRTNLTPAEASFLRLLMLANNGVLLTPEHTAQGLAWMRRFRDDFPAACFDRFSHFSFQGHAVNVREDSHYVVYYVPVWRIHIDNGDVLDYAAACWQSGADIRPRIFLPSLP